MADGNDNFSNHFLAEFMARYPMSQQQQQQQQQQPQKSSNAQVNAPRQNKKTDLKTKLRIIQAYDKINSYAKVAESFAIPQSTTYQIVNNREKILAKARNLGFPLTKHNNVSSRKTLTMTKKESISINLNSEQLLELKNALESIDKGVLALIRIDKNDERCIQIRRDMDKLLGPYRGHAEKATNQSMATDPPLVPKTSKNDPYEMFDF